MFSKDTPGLPGTGNAALSHIVLKWKHPTAKEECHTLYDAVDLGDTVARQRAASRAAVVSAAGSDVTKYVAYYLDGREENLA